MALLLECFTCRKHNDDVDMHDTYIYVSSLQTRYVHRPRQRLDTIEEDLHEESASNFSDERCLIDYNKQRKSVALPTANDMCQ